MKNKTWLKEQIKPQPFIIVLYNLCLNKHPLDDLLTIVQKDLDQSRKKQ